MTIKTLQNQTVYDVAVMYYGTCEAVGLLLADNPDLVNDPAALASVGIGGSDALYLDVALLKGQDVYIDAGSRVRQMNTLRDIQGKEITTFNT